MRRLPPARLAHLHWAVFPGIDVHVNSSIHPRRWQRAALEEWTRDLSGIARVVTGGGKTVFAYLCLERFFERFPDGRALIVVPTISLLDQWFVDIIDATSITEAEVSCYSGESTPDSPAKINLLVLNTARTRVEELSTGKPTILVVDECHRAGSPKNSKALAGDHEATLGLSATPEREQDDGLEVHLEPTLGSIIYTYDYPAARKDGVIVEFELVNVEIAIDEDALALSPLKNRADSLRERLDNPDCSDHTVAKSVTKTAKRAARVPWAVKLAISHRDQRIIVFHERVDSVTRIQAALKECGQNSVAYHSDLSASHRRDNLRLFRSGAINVLVTCRALDEGTNVPEANVAIVAHSTSSTRQRIQRLGRVLRPAAGKAHARVYTFYTSEEERERLVEEAHGLQGVAGISWKRGTLG